MSQNLFIAFGRLPRSQAKLPRFEGVGFAEQFADECGALSNVDWKRATHSAVAKGLNAMSELIGEYRVAEAFSGGDLAREVNDLIQDGWQPFGPMIATPTPADGVELLQPMVRTQLRKPRRLTFLLSALHNR